MSQLFSRKLNRSLHSRCVHHLDDRLLVRWKVRVFVNEPSCLLQEILVELADFGIDYAPHQVQIRFIVEPSDSCHFVDWQSLLLENYISTFLLHDSEVNFINGRLDVGAPRVLRSRRLL